MLRSGEEVSVADIRIGVQCGASDWTTAAAANPAIGYCSDLIVKKRRHLRSG